MTSIPSEQKVRRLFHPGIDTAIARVKGNRYRFVYYTTAETAALILSNREIWLRNSMAMNDYAEIDYGLNCVWKALASSSGADLRRCFDECHPDAWAASFQSFNDWALGIKLETYLICLSEHSESEDLLGRLSMWRAYGGDAGVAIVMNCSFVLDEENPSNVGIYASPVSYFTDAELSIEFGVIADRIRAERELFNSLGRQRAQDWLFWKLRHATICTKHPGFHEELEWRMFCSPAMHQSPIVSEITATVRGIPQKVLRLPLVDRPEHGVRGLSLPSLIDRVIIGPCNLPWVIAQGIERILSDCGVADAGRKVKVSSIPIRRW